MSQYTHIHVILAYLICIHFVHSMAQLNTTKSLQDYKGPGCNKIKFINVDNTCPEAGKFAIAGDCTKFFDCFAEEDGRLSHHTSYCPKSFNFNGNDCVPDSNQFQCYQTDCIVNTNSSEEESTEQRKVKSDIIFTNAKHDNTSSSEDNELVPPKIDFGSNITDEKDKHAQNTTEIRSLPYVNTGDEIPHYQLRNQTSHQSLPGNVLKLEVIVSVNHTSLSNQATIPTPTSVLTAKSGPLNISEDSLISNVSVVKSWNGKIFKVTIGGANQESNNDPNANMSSVKIFSHTAGNDPELNSQLTNKKIQEPEETSNVTFDDQHRKANLSTSPSSETSPSEETDIISGKKVKAGKKTAGVDENSNSIFITSIPQLLNHEEIIDNNSENHDKNVTQGATNTNTTTSLRQMEILNDARNEKQQESDQQIVVSSGHCLSIFLLQCAVFMTVPSIIKGFLDW